MRLTCPICNTAARIDLPLTGESLPQMLDRIERDILVATLKRTYGNQRAAARDLGMAYHAVRHLVEKHGLKSETFS